MLFYIKNNKNALSLSSLFKPLNSDVNKKNIQKSELKIFKNLKNYTTKEILIEKTPYILFFNEKKSHNIFDKILDLTSTDNFSSLIKRNNIKEEEKEKIVLWDLEYDFILLNKLYSSDLFMTITSFLLHKKRKKIVFLGKIKRTINFIDQKIENSHSGVKLLLMLFFAFLFYYFFKLIF